MLKLLYGAEKMLHTVEDVMSRLIVLDYDHAAASQYGDIRANLKRKGTPIGVNDLNIAAHESLLKMLFTRCICKDNFVEIFHVVLPISKSGAHGAPYVLYIRRHLTPNLDSATAPPFQPTSLYAQHSSRVDHG